MTNRQIDFLGWILFVVSAIGFIIASIGSFWGMFGSVFFLIACLVFMIPFFRKEKQMGAIAFGLIAAFAWGLHDVLVRYVSEKNDLITCLFAVLVFGLIAQLPLIMVFGYTANLSAEMVWTSVFAGVAFAVASIGLYNAFKRGPVSLVAPLIGCYPVVSFLIAAFRGADVMIAQWLVLALMIIGIGLISRAHAEENTEQTENNLAITVGYCVMAIFGFALTFALGHSITATADPLVTGIITRLVAVFLIGVLLVVILVMTQRKFVMPDNRSMLILALMGSLDAVALGMVLAAGIFERPEFAAAASSTFGLVTVILAWMFMREAINKIQWTGIAAVFFAIAYLAFT